MKKRVFFIIAAAVLMVGVAVGLLFFCGKDTPETESSADEPKRSLAEALFKVDYYEELKEIAKEYQVEIDKMDIHCLVQNVEWAGEKITFVFQFDGNGVLYKANSYLEFDSSSGEVEAFRSKAGHLMDEFAELFAAQVDNYYVTSSEAIYDCKDPQSMERVMNGEAKAKLKLRDADGRYWELCIGSSGSGYICTIDRHPDDVKLHDVPVNIDLS